MADQTGPRKLTTCGGMNVVSIPNSFLQRMDGELGDRYVLEVTDDGFRARKAEWVVSGDV